MGGGGKMVGGLDIDECLWVLCLGVWGGCLDGVKVDGGAVMGMGCGVREGVVRGKTEEW